MKIIPIVFTINEDFLLPTSIAIQSLLDSKKQDTEYKIYIIHDGLSKKAKEKFEKIYPIKWVYVDKSTFKNAPIKKIWPEVVYYRLMIPELIKNEDKIIYSDVDVLFKKDLQEAFDTDISEYYFAGVAMEKNTPNTVLHKYFEENKNENIYSSGFMVINAKKWREENITQKLMDNIEIYKDRLKYFDLDLLNITCPKIAKLPFDYCVLYNIHRFEKTFLELNSYSWFLDVYSLEEIQNAKDNPCIIHYAGYYPKIWNRKPVEIPEYYWKYIAGSPFYNKKFYYPNVFECIKLNLFAFLAVIYPSKKIKNRLINYLKRRKYYIK